MPAGGQDVLEVLGLLVVHLPDVRFARTSENPRIAFSGVRSSWDMLARNSDLWRLAAWSCRLLSAISRNRRAFSEDQGGLGSEGLEEVP